MRRIFTSLFCLIFQNRKCWSNIITRIASTLLIDNLTELAFYVKPVFTFLFAFFLFIFFFYRFLNVPLLHFLWNFNMKIHSSGVILKFLIKIAKLRIQEHIFLNFLQRRFDCLLPFFEMLINQQLLMFRAWNSSNFSSWA